jgi:hypothetical protein
VIGGDVCWYVAGQNGNGDDWEVLWEWRPV